jgi:hypothetical protein
MRALRAVRLRYASTLVVGLICVGALTAPAASSSAAPGTGCLQLLRYFYVRSANLTETVTAHWNVNVDAGYTATVDTTQTGTMRYSGGLPSRAVRSRRLGYANFTELRYVCRIPDYSQGVLAAYAPMTYSLQGTWSAGQENGRCSNQKSEPRYIGANFVRRSLNWRYPSVGFGWDFNRPPMPGCSVTAYSTQLDAYEPVLLNSYGTAQLPARQMTLTKERLLGATRLTLPVNLHAADSVQGMKATFDLRGTVVLQRYKACSISNLQQILYGRCWDATVP